ncbi:SRPBCC domain-containing protein [Methylocystis sp.]|uniref:SRPBCC domain-containing protein n=1 Tax=Methylocystis sp. TaxID=1911079 RepID=UPI0025EEDBF5|nr:SRPBCC domain-containing protein [Methylocystis sp.]
MARIYRVLTMADEGSGTRYIARVMHKSDAERRRHEELGFYDGWGACITQLEEAAQGIS